ncbi:hypothetical protein [Agrobacterium larrymoorei]|uniref:DGQHR domain-containing protein n=1 Tax=Agrobacterium larrymoorei TaxID=160699 RepID=A0A4D7E466_9HYPH|nr:hypothetical protein [Agrobacterium larrymoorei]QCJ00897.1 hypothetical protein CFBP5473_23140 [Agrobacterium larrymoorei]QYA10233.1 hypothetical protein J5285_23810 [Agrobacterium larrymoorei]
MSSHRYPCVQVIQDGGSKELLMFSASAIEIDAWVGIPQRLDLKGSETAGFQRTVSPRREAALRKFFSEPANVIQNPLLCAIRQDPGVAVSFEPEGDSGLGYVTITFPDYQQKSLLDLLKEAREYVEERAPFLKDRPAPVDLVDTLQQQMPDLSSLSATEEEVEDLTEDAAYEVELSTEPAEEALFDESQITDFWDQLRAREEILSKFVANVPNDAILGFSREVLESYLRPVILVDGQHRLRGAVLAVQDEVNTSDEAETMILEGESAREAKQKLMRERARKLPISLLMDSSPAEHVFQYVLVNQKATPVPRALLGTIISTSLAANELKTIADRLEDADIQLQGSRIISILSRADDSPFKNLVAKGLDQEGIDKLQWSVLGSLADMFRYLVGGRYYHDSVDHAKTWRSHHLADSPIVQDWQAREFSSPYEYWQDINGPWMQIFKAFWAKTRDSLADTENEAAPNYWGRTRTSNIFNKPSLHILSADFFAYLKERRYKIESADQIGLIVDEWLAYVKKNYFARNWKLEGVKKDAVGTRKQWSKLWVNHRQNGEKLPAPEEFSKPFKSV